VILPGVLITLLTIWPWLDRSSRAATGLWFPTTRRTQNLVFILVMVAILVLTYIGMALRGPYWDFYWPWQSWPDIPTRI
jgi:quinol-cytochrome oxidoreductase complex cytochrome b subunit